MNKDKRKNRLMPNGIPRWIRCYDNPNGLSMTDTIDRYTVVFTGLYNNIGRQKRGLHMRSSHFYIGMSAAPYHPQGFCQHGETLWRCCDVDDHGWPPAIGRKCHLGKRISFESLPQDCKKVVVADYKEIWEIE